MSRPARIVLPDTPHHVTQRGNRRMEIFSESLDFALYRDLLAERLKFHAVVCSAYCLMPNHVHLLLTPTCPDVASASANLSRSVGEAHRRYTAFVNARARTTGHLFQGRFGCVAMDEAHWLAAVRYFAFNPVRAGLCERPQDWPWSSVGAHLRGRGDGCVDVSKVLDVAPRFADLLEPSSERRQGARLWQRSEATPAPSATPRFSPAPKPSSAARSPPAAQAESRARRALRMRA